MQLIVKLISKIFPNCVCYFSCSQLLPHAANIVRLLTEYFRRATLPSIRIRVYSIMQILLISMGVGKSYLISLLRKYEPC